MANSEDLTPGDLSTPEQLRGGHPGPLDMEYAGLVLLSMLQHDQVNTSANAALRGYLAEMAEKLEDTNHPGLAILRSVTSYAGGRLEALGQKPKWDPPEVAPEDDPLEENLAKMEATRRTAVDGLDSAALAEAYADVLGRLAPILARTPDGRQLWHQVWSEVAPGRIDQGWPKPTPGDWRAARSPWAEQIRREAEAEWDEANRDRLGD